MILVTPTMNLVIKREKKKISNFNDLKLNQRPVMFIVWQTSFLNQIKKL